VDSIYEIEWAPGVTYGDVRHADELQFSVYNFERANVEQTWKHLELYEAECKELLASYQALKEASDGKPPAGGKRFPVLAAFDLCLKCSHLFNILDARGAISVTERVGVIARVRQLAVGVAKAYLDQQTGGSQEAAPPAEKKKVRRSGRTPNAFRHIAV
jgi:glycyl-tRNA synthetase alpha chain